MKNSGFLFSLFLLFSIASNACVSSRTQAGPEPSNSNAAQPLNSSPEAEKSAVRESSIQQGEIRKVDFKNFTYEPFCAGEEKTKVTVKKGEFSQEKTDEQLYFDVRDITYGDVNGDKDEDAIIVTNCNTGGTGQFTEGFVYTMKNGKPELLTRIEGGDRAYGGLISAKVEGNLLVVDRNDVSEDSGACCPEFAVTTRYKWDGSKLVESGKADRRELYPATRISFEKGKSSTEITVTVPGNEIKRFSVGARSGQTLSVTGDSKSFSYSLIKGEADIQDNELGFNAKLNESGDFVFQIQNITEKEGKAVVKIQIK